MSGTFQMDLATLSPNGGDKNDGCRERVMMPPNHSVNRRLALEVDDHLFIRDSIFVDPSEMQ